MMLLLGLLVFRLWNAQASAKIEEGLFLNAVWALVIAFIPGGVPGLLIYFILWMIIPSE